MGMPFGMIFAIFLIVVFVVIAGIAVSGFLDIGKGAQVGMFYEDLQEAVSGAMRGQSSDASFDINLPSKIESVCFADLDALITNPGVEYEAIRNYDLTGANVFLVPPNYSENMPHKIIDHLNVSKITETWNPYCVDVDDGFRVKKGFYDRLVWVE